MNEQEFLAAKADLIARKRHGDMAQAARVAGISFATFRDWLSLKRSYRNDARNFKALLKVIENREKELKRATKAG